MATLSPQNAETIIDTVKRNADFLASCRSLTAGMELAIKAFRDRLTKTAQRTDLGKMMPSAIAARHMSDITADIAASMGEAAKVGATCITDGDVILTYGRSCAVEQALVTAHASGTDFTVMVVDAAPLFEGRGLQWRLQQRGVKTSYVLLTSVCAIIPRCTRVFIGAVSVLQNGQVVGRAGSAVVSLVAKQFRKPLLCFCETYKFTERIWRNANQEQPGGGTSARYDTTPKDLVDILVTDIGFLHPSAIAAAIRDRDDREARASDPF
jgi:translation initiation factor 2B subunit (eIF-2B alpha/beta/delta family)